MTVEKHSLSCHRTIRRCNCGCDVPDFFGIETSQMGVDS